MVWWQSVGSQTCKLSQTTGRNLWCFELQGGFDKEKYDVFQGKRGFTTKTEELTQQNLVNSAGGFHQILDWNSIRFLGVSGKWRFQIEVQINLLIKPGSWVQVSQLDLHIANTECHDDKRFEIHGPLHCKRRAGHVNFQSLGISHFCIDIRVWRFDGCFCTDNVCRRAILCKCKIRRFLKMGVPQ